MALPRDSFLFLLPRSSYARSGLTVLGGICDSDYVEKPLFFFLRNDGHEPIVMRAPCRPVQGILIPCLKVGNDTWMERDRGQSGSSGS